MVKLGIAGATGVVGGEVLNVLATRGIAIGSLRLFASAASVERKLALSFKDVKIAVEDLATADFRGIDIVIFDTPNDVARKFVPLARDAGCIAIDNSSAFRLDDSVPLVVPEINAHAVKHHRGIVANPNCTTAITFMGVSPLHRAFGAKRMSVTSYQAASGAGVPGLRELQAQLVSHHEESRVGDGRWKQRMYSDVFPFPIALNVFPYIGNFLENASTDEEMKVLKEGQKIMDLPLLRVSTTCVRVPVERVHCMDVLAQFERSVDIAAAYDALRKMPGLDVFEGEQVPTPLDYAGVYNCAVARVRIDQAFENALRFWVIGDQLLKGAALNAVQILELLLK